MQATLPARRGKIRSVQPLAAQPAPTLTAVCVAEEIHSFIAVRDILLAEAEEETTEANLHRLWMANEFAERCLEPSRAPYEGQSLAPAEIIPERQRCQTVKVRMVELRSRVRRQAA